MLGRSHVAVGLATYLLVWPGARLVSSLGDFPPSIAGTPLSDAWVLPASLLVVGLAAIAPDIDHPDSEVARIWRAPAGIHPLKAVAWMIRALFGHRGITHSAWLLGLIAWYTEYLAQVNWGVTGVGGCLGFGFASHLLADAVTRSGVPLLWPLQWRFGLPPIRALRLRTGGHGEQIVVGMLVLVALAKMLEA